MSTPETLYYLYAGNLVRVFLDEDGLPDTADVYDPKTGEHIPDPVLAIDSQMGSSGFTRIDETTYNTRLDALRKQDAAG